MVVAHTIPSAIEPPSVLPHEFKDFRGHHSGETLLVCGCGSSLSQIIAPERLVSIGVNDVGRLFDPDYLVVLNPRNQFTGDRFRYVEQSRARVVFTQLDLGIPHRHVVRFRLGRRAGTDFSDPNLLPYTRNSPYPALCLAIHMGARRIGLIGVDFTDHHFFATTGRHSLAGEFTQIDQEYRQLHDSCLRRDIEIFNLSRDSRLTAFPKMEQEDFMEAAVSPRRPAGRRLFFVNYQFLSCGSVFQDGLGHAADQLGLEWKAAPWDDSTLPEKVRAFAPEVLFVVHGRKFSARWRSGFANYQSAVWLLDEPYEVDDTSRFSSLFETAFVNDPNTLHRHRNAHYLPVCYDPRAHSYRSGEDRPHAVGFVGGFNPHREQALSRLAHRGLLSYVVGGPWADTAVKGLCQSGNIPAEQTAVLYRGTRILVNLFRSQHHFNRAGIPAVSLNPRVYEGLACGALVISEYRPELDTICPEMPAFRTMEEMEAQIERHLRDQELFARVRKACIRRLSSHTYARRLATVISTILTEPEVTMTSPTCPPELVSTHNTPVEAAPAPVPTELVKGWEATGDCILLEPDGGLLLRKAADEGPGTEQGLAAAGSYRNLVLEFEVRLQADTVFIAKIHQAEAKNQLRNSYHLMCRGGQAYLARHNHVFCNLVLPVDAWVPISFSFLDGTVVIRKSGAQVARAQDAELEAGFCFLGVRGGAARLRNIRIKSPGSLSVDRAPLEHEVLHASPAPTAPKVSIITTVYDRVDCLLHCLQSVQALNFKNYEHIVVADGPPNPVLRQIEDLVKKYSAASGRLTLATLRTRKNDWGISPAAAGLALAQGEYVCFLSDDNGYKPDHFDRLVTALDRDPSIGFVYSSCLYAGRGILCATAPRAGAIDLGQPLFRRQLFDRYLGGTLPFHEFGWDWRMIETFMRNGVRWRHVNEATFVFRLARYPQIMASQPCGLQP